jgi:hypothetical protein
LYNSSKHPILFLKPCSVCGISRPAMRNRPSIALIGIETGESPGGIMRIVFSEKLQFLYLNI